MQVVKYYTSASGGQRCAAPREMGGTNDVTVSNGVNLVDPLQYVLGEVLKATLPYLESAAGVVHSRLLLYKPHCTS